MYYIHSEWFFDYSIEYKNDTVTILETLLNIKKLNLNQFLKSNNNFLFLTLKCQNFNTKYVIKNKFIYLFLW